MTNPIGAWRDISGALRAIVLFAALCLASAAVLSGAQSVTIGIPSFSEVPNGCDAFGYSRQAQLFRARGLFGGLDTGFHDPTEIYLTDKAKALALPLSEWDQALAPHCHHYDRHSGKVILQYPPGTGLLMSLFSFKKQARMLHLVSTVFIAAMWMYYISLSPSLGSAFLTGCAGVLTLIGPDSDRGSFSPWPSTAMTLLIPVFAWRSFEAIGRDQAIKRYLALGLLIGFAVNVRIPNLLLASGFYAVLIWQFATHRERLPLLSGLSLTTGIALGSLPTLAANWLNTGSPFRSTYSPVDTAAPDLSIDTVVQGLNFYFDSGLWSDVLLTGSCALVLLLFCLRDRLSGRSRHALLAAVAVSLLVSIAFFTTHAVRIHYYLNAAAVLAAASVCLIVARERSSSLVPRPANALVLTGFLIALGFLAHHTKHRPFPIPTLEVSPQAKSEIDKGAVVWSDLLGGFVVTYLHTYASKIVFASPRAQDKLVDSVHADHRTQVFVVDSANMTTTVSRLRERYDLVEIGKVFGAPAFIIR